VVRFTLGGNIFCPSRAPTFLERDGRKTVSEKGTRDNEKTEWGIGVLLWGWPWAYKKARPSES